MDSYSKDALTLDKVSPWIDLVPGDRFKALQRLVASSEGNLCMIQREAAKSHKDDMVPNARSYKSDGRGFESQCRQHFQCKVLLKSPRCTLLWKLNNVFVRDVHCVILSCVYMGVINPESK